MIHVADDAAFERAVYATKSFIIALAICKGHLSANDASEAAQVEVRNQIERWGEVEDSKSKCLLKISTGAQTLTEYSTRCGSRRHPSGTGIRSLYLGQGIISLQYICIVPLTTAP